MTKVFKFTIEGKQKAEEELQYLKTNGRADVAEKIKIARGYGDLSENSEYDAAKNEQAQMEARITELEFQLSHAEIIEEKKGPIKEVGLRTIVEIENTATGDVFKYSIVGTAETNPKEGKISDECPVGKALIGKKVGQKAVLNINGSEIEYLVKSLSKMK